MKLKITIELDDCSCFKPASIGVRFTLEGKEMANTVSIPQGKSSKVTLVYLDSNGQPDLSSTAIAVVGPTGVSSDETLTTLTENGDGTFTASELSSALVGGVSTLTFTDANGLTGTGTVTALAASGTGATFVPASIGVSFGVPA